MSTAFHGFFEASKVGKTGLVDVTIDIDSVNLLTGARTALITGAACVEGRDGWYTYLYAGAITLKTHDYIAVLKTADLTVDHKWVVGIRWNATDIDQIVDDVWDEVLTGATHNVANSSGRRLRNVTADIIIDGLVVSSTDNTIVLDAGASAVDGAYDPGLIFIATGTGAGQSRLILEYHGATRTCVLDRDLKVPLDGTSAYVIVAHPGREHVNEGLARAGTATSIQLNALASTVNDAYNGQSVFIRSGTGEDQVRIVQDYDGATQTAYVDTWGVTPDITSGYVMLPCIQGVSNDMFEAFFLHDTGLSHLDAIDGSIVKEIMDGVPPAAFVPGAFEFQYTVTGPAPALLPVQGVVVWVSTDIAGLNIVWRGTTNTFGLAKDINNLNPWLDAGLYYFWTSKPGWTPSLPYPDPEVVP